MATLTHAMLADLHVGNASIALLPYTATGLDITSAVSFAAADKIYTLEGSFNLSADDPSGTDIRIDQHREVIDVNVEKGGNWQMTGNIPSTASALIAYFFDSGQATGTVTGTESSTYTGTGYMATPNIIEVSVLVESESKNTAILFPHVKMVVSPIKKDDNSNPAYISFVGYVLPNPYMKTNAYVGDFAVLTASSE